MSGIQVKIGQTSGIDLVDANKKIFGKLFAGVFIVSKYTDLNTQQKLQIYLHLQLKMIFHS